MKQLTHKGAVIVAVVVITSILLRNSGYVIITRIPSFFKGDPFDQNFGFNS